MNIDLKEFTDIDRLSGQPLAIKLLVVFIICGAFFMAASWGLLYPKFQDWQRFQQLEPNLKQKLADVHYEAAALPQLRQQVLQIKLRFRRLLKQLPQQNQVSQLIHAIAAAANNSGLVWHYTKPQRHEVHDVYIVLPFTIEVEGTYHQFALFISRLAAMRQLVSVNDFDITHIADNDSTLNFPKERLRMILQVKTYQYNGNTREEKTKHRRGQAE